MALLLTAQASRAADCASSAVAPDIKVRMTAQEPIRAGEPVEISWNSIANGAKDCRYPLYLVFTTNARVRFEGEGFLAMPPGGKGPYGIGEKLDRTRVFIPLHASPEAALGAFKIKFFSAGENSVDWFVTRVPANPRDEKNRISTVLAAAKQPLLVAVASGKPSIVVRDAFTPDIATAGATVERPKKKIVSNSNEFELQIFDKFYRVYDIRSGEIIMERAGINPNFSPSSRFIGAFAEGAGFEIADLYADAVIAASGALNRHGGYEGTAHLAAWSRDDTIVALSFWGYGGVFLQQTLVDGPGIGDGMPSCHACQGIGTTLFLNYETGIVAWSGQEQGWGSLFDSSTGSRQAKAQAEKEIPLPPDDFTNLDRQLALQKKLSLGYLTQMGSKYLFDAGAFLKKLPENGNVTNYDGKAWHLGDDLRLSHACTQDAADNCSSLGEESAEGRAALKLLTSKRVEHHGAKKDSGPGVQLADTRLFSARAVARGPSYNQDRNIWQRLKQLGVPVSDRSRLEVPVQSFDLEAVLANPAQVVTSLTSKIPSVNKIVVNRSGLDSLEPPGNLAEGQELKQIDPEKVRHIVNWNIAGTEYFLIHENYQSGNSATPNNQYLHLVSGNASGISSLIDLSTRIAVDGMLAKSTDQDPEGLAHLWPSDFDIVTIVADRYLLASGHWLHDADRWALVYDLKENKTLFLNGYLPNATATKSLSITNNGRIFVVANSNGQVYFYNVNSGKQVLAGNYVDDELAIYDPNGYYMSTYEGSQFVFLKFPGTPGYLSFKQFAKVLQRPDIVKGVLAGSEASEAPELALPPRLTLSATNGTPGELHVSLSAASSRELAKLRLFVDGQLWREQPIGGHEYRLDQDLSIPAQARWLTAVAVDAAGSESVPVAHAISQYVRPSDRKLHIFAVGTDTYTNLDTSLQLHFAVSDAQSFMSAVKAQKSGYYKTIGAKPFLNAPGLKTELPRALQAVAVSATQDDTIMLFVSGHGYRSPDNKLYLVLTDSVHARLEETSLSWDDLARSFEGTKARIIIFIDACHSGAVPDGGSNDEIADALSARQVRFTVVAAAKGRQESFEKPSLGGGVFTSAIVKALTRKRAAIDTNNNGVVELSELYSEIKPDVLTEMGGRQTPWLARADMVGEVPLF